MLGPESIASTVSTRAFLLQEFAHQGRYQRGALSAMPRSDIWVCWYIRFRYTYNAGIGDLGPYLWNLVYLRLYLQKHRRFCCQSFLKPDSTIRTDHVYTTTTVSTRGYLTVSEAMSTNSELKSIFPPSSSAEVMRQISLVLKIPFETADVSTFIY